MTERATRITAVAILTAAVLSGCASAGADSNAATTTAAPSASMIESAPASTAPSASAALVGDQAVPVVVQDATPILPTTITDVVGTDVTVSDISRIVSLSGGITETLFALGLGSNVVGRDVSTDFPGTDEITLVTNAHDVSAEGVLALRPTLVIADTRTGPPEALAAIRAAGTPVVLVPEVWTLEDAAARNEAIASAVGLGDAGSRLTDYVTEHAATEQLAGQPVIAFLYLRGSAAVYLMGGDGSGADSIIEALGGVDAGTAAGLGAFTPLTPESLAKANPDPFLVMTKGLESVGGIDGLLELPGIAQTPAGRAGRVIAVPDGELLSFGPRTPQTLAAISSQFDALPS